nr:unnamed protein product [Callosobruchus chinensis]
MLSDWLSNMQKRTMSIRNQHLKNSPTKWMI